MRCVFTPHGGRLSEHERGFVSYPNQLDPPSYCEPQIPFFLAVGEQGYGVTHCQIAFGLVMNASLRSVEVDCANRSSPW